MKRVLENATLLTVLLLTPLAAQAGWVSQWTNIATKPNGERMDPQSSSMAIAGGRVRLEQSESITLVDYNTGKFTVMNPAKQVFWSGTIDEYVLETAQSRTTAMQKSLGDAGAGKNAQLSGTPALPKVDPAKLPPLSILKTDVTEKIAGSDTLKYDVRVDGDLFQELWVAPGVDVSADLNVDKYLALQRKMSAGMMGKSANQYNALYLNEDYRKLIEKAFVLKMITHHIAGQFERTATSVRQTDVAAKEFEVPDTYRRVRLSDVLGAPPQKKS
jgi:hypothetical protein